MPKDSISRTAQVNLQMLANLGIPEALRMRDALKLDGDPLGVFSRLPLARRIPLCISCISEVLYQSANNLIFAENNPTILDIACGYSPRVLLVAPQGYTYIGADLPDVTDDLIERRREIVPFDAGWFAGYRTVDATDEEQMLRVVGALRERITVVTQGLISYLTLDEKHQLAEGVRGLLARDGGCWVLPDAEPDTLLLDTFRAVLGPAATGVVESVYGILDKRVGRDREANGWRNSDQIVEDLTSMGFAVRRIPLWRESVEMRCFEKVGEDAAENLRTTWQKKNSLIITVE